MAMIFNFTLFHIISLLLLLCTAYSVRIDISNQTNAVVWMVDIYLFAEDEPGPFSMSPNGKISVDLSVTALDSSSLCDVPAYLHIYVFDSNQYVCKPSQ